MSTEQTEKIKPENEAIKKEATDFLFRRGLYEETKDFRSFHQTLRNEILFALVPRTFEPGNDQRAFLNEIAMILTKKGLLRGEGRVLLGQKWLPDLSRTRFIYSQL